MIIPDGNCQAPSNVGRPLLKDTGPLTLIDDQESSDRPGCDAQSFSHSNTMPHGAVNARRRTRASTAKENYVSSPSAPLEPQGHTPSKLDLERVRLPLKIVIVLRRQNLDNVRLLPKSAKVLLRSNLERVLLKSSIAALPQRLRYRISALP